MEEEYEKADHVGNLKTQLNARNCKVIIAALRGFECAVSLIGNPHLDKSYAVNLNDAHEELQDAFDCYRRNNLVISQRAFSRRILGQAPSYYSSMINRNRKPSRAVLQTVLSVTKTILATFIGNPHFGKPYAVNLNHAYEELERIVEQVSVQLDIGCVVENLER